MIWLVMLRTVPFDEIKINKQKHNDSSFEKYSSRLQKNNTEFKIPDNCNKTKNDFDASRLS